MLVGTCTRTQQRPARAGGPKPIFKRFLSVVATYIMTSVRKCSTAHNSARSRETNSKHRFVRRSSRNVYIPFASRAIVYAIRTAAALSVRRNDVVYTFYMFFIAVFGTTRFLRIVDVAPGRNVIFARECRRARSRIALTLLTVATVPSSLFRAGDEFPRLLVHAVRSLNDAR